MDVEPHTDDGCLHAAISEPRAEGWWPEMNHVRWDESAVFALVLLATLGSLLVAQPASAQPAENLVRNGDFELDANGDGRPDNWANMSADHVRREGGNTWILIDRYGSVNQRIALDPDWARLVVTTRMRSTDVVLGDEGWKDARLTMEWQDADGKHLDPWPNVFHAVGSTDWVDYEREFKVPEGAVSLSLGPAMFGASGSAEFDDIRITVSRLRSRAKEDVPAPEGITNLWNMETAWKQETPTRARICLNDLWRFLPVAEPAGESVPGDKQGWGWFKVPGIWPRTETGDAQSALLSDWAADRIDLASFDQAWYRRTFSVPQAWAGRRITVDFGMVQTHAKVFVDGQPAGEVWFPGGPVDITPLVRPGVAQELAVLVTARPLETESQVFMAPDRVITSDARIDLRGLTGDVYLDAEAPGVKLGDIGIVTSFRQKQIRVEAMIEGDWTGDARLRAVVMDGDEVVKEITSEPSTAADAGGRLTCEALWDSPKLWDLDTPENMYEVRVSLLKDSGELIDEAFPVRFGFREFWIDGRDFVLNGKPVHLRALHTNNINRGANLASFEGCMATLERMKEYGFNFLITGNYHFKPGSVGYMDGLLEACDRAGVLCSFSLPHVRDFRMNPEEPETGAAYERLTDWLIRRVRNHPGMVMYAMNHNATGYYGDQNPLKIDGIYSPENPDVEGAAPRRIRQEALMAQEIARGIDPTRPIYHHQSGNLGDMHTVNIYLNWAPLQERSDWLEHWGTVGVKPLFFVEWGLPHISSWSSYRGPAFIWRTEAFQWIWDSEYAAPYVGERAYEMTPTKVRSMAHEEDLWSRGKPFHWGYLNQHMGRQTENYLEIQALFAADNWRSHRTWGVSAMLPWDQGGLWEPAPGRSDRVIELAAKYEGLQKPGIVPDRLLPGGQYIDAADPESRKLSVLGEAFLRWNMPLCAYIGGGPEGFTEKGHNFLPGETVQKQLVILNDTRQDVECEYRWTLGKDIARGEGSVSVPAGGKQLVPVSADLPPILAPGSLRLAAEFRVDGKLLQGDGLDIHVLPGCPAPANDARIALFDPLGASAVELEAAGISFERVAPNADLTSYDLLIIGRQALTVDGPAPDLARVRDGLKVLVLEQDHDTLVSRFGFRANIHGERKAFIRARNHPVLAGLGEVNLADWRGAATLVPPYLETPGVETSDPRWNWMGFINTRVWRCGNRGNVASVLIEKPPVGNFMPIVDCGFDLQYAPLLEYTEGNGRMIFCQLDVSARTSAEPAAQRLLVNLVGYLLGAQAAPSRPVFYAGGGEGAGVLASLGVDARPCDAAAPPADSVLVVGPGASEIDGLEDAVQRGLRVLCLGLGEGEMPIVLPEGLGAEKRAEVSSRISDMTRPEYTALSDAELHWKTKPEIAALTGVGEGGNSALAVIEKGQGRVVLCQAAPWMFDWANKTYLRTTHRRNVYLVSRLLHNLGAQASCPLLERAAKPGQLYDWVLPADWKGRVDRKDEGQELGWQREDFTDTDWAPIAVPGAFDKLTPGLENYDGVFWYRLRFRVPDNLGRENVVLKLGGIDDESWVWLNGNFLGEVTKQSRPEDYWSFPREYALDGDLLRRDGANVLVVKVRDTYLSGGIMGTPRITATAPWMNSYYVDVPESVDDPFRYYRW